MKSFHEQMGHFAARDHQARPLLAGRFGSVCSVAPVVGRSLFCWPRAGCGAAWGGAACRGLVRRRDATLRHANAPCLGHRPRRTMHLLDSPHAGPGDCFPGQQSQRADLATDVGFSAAARRWRRAQADSDPGPSPASNQPDRGKWASRVDTPPHLRLVHTGLGFRLARSGRAWGQTTEVQRLDRRMPTEVPAQVRSKRIYQSSSARGQTGRWREAGRRLSAEVQRSLNDLSHSGRTLTGGVALAYMHHPECVSHVVRLPKAPA